MLAGSLGCVGLGVAGLVGVFTLLLMLVALSGFLSGAVRFNPTAANTLRFVESPPLTLDDQLDFKVTNMRGGVPLVASTFGSCAYSLTRQAIRTCPAWTASPRRPCWWSSPPR